MQMRKRSDKNGARFRGDNTEEILIRNTFPYIYVYRKLD